MTTTTSIKEEIDNLVADHLERGEYYLFMEDDTYRQHCLREHPNVCRQTERHTAHYRLHPTPCDCPPISHSKPQSAVKTVYCEECFLTIPEGTSCPFCDFT